MRTQNAAVQAWRFNVVRHIAADDENETWAYDPLISYAGGGFPATSDARFWPYLDGVRVGGRLLNVKGAGFTIRRSRSSIRFSTERSAIRSTRSALTIKRIIRRRIPTPQAIQIYDAKVSGRNLHDGLCTPSSMAQSADRWPVRRRGSPTKARTSSTCIGRITKRSSNIVTSARSGIPSTASRTWRTFATRAAFDFSTSWGPFETFNGDGTLRATYLRAYSFSTSRPLGTKLTLGFECDGTLEAYPSPQAGTPSHDGQQLRRVSVGESLGDVSNLALSLR